MQQQSLPNLSNYIQFLIIKKSFLKNKSKSDYVLGCCKGVINNTDNYKNKKKEKKQYNNYKVELSLVCKKWYQQIIQLNKRFHWELNKKKKIGTNYLADLANEKLVNNVKSLLLYDKRYIKVLVLHFSTSSKYSKHRDKIGFKNTHCKKITDQDIEWIVNELPMLEIVKIKSEPLYIDEIYRIVKYIDECNSGGNGNGNGKIKVQLKLNFQFHSIPSPNPLDYPSELNEKYSLEQFKCIDKSTFKLYSYENSHGFSDQFIEQCLRYYKVGYTNLEIYHGSQEEEGYFKLNTSEIFSKSGFPNLVHLDFGRFNSTPIERLIAGLSENQLETLRSGISFSRFNKGHSFQEGCNFTDELITDNKHQQWMEFCRVLSVNQSLKRLHLFDFYRSPNDQDDLSCNGDDDFNSTLNQQQTIQQQQAYFNEDIEYSEEQTTSSIGEDGYIDTESTHSQTSDNYQSDDNDDDDTTTTTTTIIDYSTITDGNRKEIKTNKYVGFRMDRFSKIWSTNTNITFLNLQDFRHLPASFYLVLANSNKTIKHLLLSNSTMDNINDDNGLILNAFIEMISNNKTIQSLSINSKYIQFTTDLIKSFQLNSTIKNLSIEGCSNINITQFFNSLLKQDTIEYISISKYMKKQSQNYFTNSKTLIIKYIENDKNKNYNFDFTINWYRLIKNE